MHILHLEHDPNDIELVRRLLHQEWPACVIEQVERRGEFVAALSRTQFDVVLSDYRLPGFDGMVALTLARQLAPETPFIFFSGSIGEDQAIAAVQAGATDYVIKDRMKRLVTAMRRAVADRQERVRRRAAETSLVASQARYQRLIDKLPDAIFSLTGGGIITAVSPAFETLTGWKRHAWINRNFRELVHDSDRALAEQMLAQLRRGAHPTPVELRLAAANGGATTLEFTAGFHADGNADGEILAIGRSIGARQEAERLIHEQAEVISKAPVAIVIADLDNRLRYWNAGAEKLYGWQAAEVLGRSADDFFEGTTLERLRAGRQYVLEHGSWRGEISARTKAGQPLELEFSMSLIRDSAGQPKGRLSIAIDVTEQKGLREQFLRAQRLENLGLLAAGIAHDFNNILTPTLMVAQILRDRLQGPSEQRLLDTLEQAAERGAGLVKQILAFADGRGDNRRAEVQLKHLAREMVAMMEETFPRNIRVEQAIQSEVWPVHANPTHLHQILLNLCVNARDAMPGGGTLFLGLANQTLDPAAAAAFPEGRSGRFVELTIRDTGVGIAPEVLPRIWEPFFTTRAPGQGTGLGLSTVRVILRSYDAFAHVESGPGRGTTFRLFFPAVADAALSAPPAEAASPLPRGHGETILVIEDESDVRELTRTILTRQGYQVQTARDGVEAMNLLRLRPSYVPRLIITDLLMPRLGGAALVPLLRRQHPQACILVISGIAPPASAAGPGNSPAAPPDSDAFLLKPFKPDALLRIVHQLLAAPAQLT